MTFIGGIAALRLRHRLSLLSCVAAGIVLGVAMFDLYPEAIALGAPTSGTRPLALALALGFGSYLLIDRGLGAAVPGTTRWRLHLAPTMLTLHSLVDGFGIGVSFQLDARAGWLIALAVLAHDFADGLNTVGVSLGGHDKKFAGAWLAVNSMAPIVGVLVGKRLHLTSDALALLLAAFAGIFLYMGGCELLPRSQAQEPRLRNTLASLAGMTIMALVTGFGQ